MVSREVAESLQASVKIAPWVWLERAANTNSVKFGFIPTLSASAYTDTTGMSFTSFSPTSNSVTIAPVGVTVRVTGFGEALRPDSIAQVAQEEGKGLGAKIDTDLAALFPSFSSSVGTTNTSMTTATWLSAIGVLNAAKVPDADRIGVLPVVAYQALLSDSQSKNAYAFQETARSGVIPDYFGVKVVFSPLTTTANSAVDGVGAMFNRRAIGLGLLKDITVDVQKAPAQYNATDIAATAYYGVALVGGSYGCKIIAKNS
jgi:hypothetical protein